MFLEGYLEGFYGRLLSWQDRSILLKTLSQLEMNIYIYGPKEDPYHRIEWFKLYPDNELKNLKNFKKEATKLGITPYFSLSPGLSFKGDEELDLEKLKKKYGTKLNRYVHVFQFIMIFEFILKIIFSFQKRG